MSEKEGKTLTITPQTPTVSLAMVQFPTITRLQRKMMENSWVVPVGEEGSIKYWISQSLVRAKDPKMSPKRSINRGLYHQKNTWTLLTRGF